VVLIAGEREPAAAAPRRRAGDGGGPASAPGFVLFFVSTWSPRSASRRAIPVDLASGLDAGAVTALLGTALLPSTWRTG
jgi:hypothetical protein